MAPFPVVVVSGEAGLAGLAEEDGLPLFWPPFEVDISEGDARFETGGPGNT